MIKINLLPPELRKRSASFDPLKLLSGVELALCALLLAFGAYLQWIKIPAAQATLDRFSDTADNKATQAQAVSDKEAKLQEFQEQVDTLRNLLAHKTYWAHTLDDFCTLLGSTFPQGSHLRCLELTINPASSDRRAEGGGGGDKMLFQLKGTFELIGDLNVNSGEYINDMFRQIAASSFWRDHGFIGKPEDSYFGDHPKFNKDIGKVVVPLNLEFKRLHIVASAKPAAPAEGG